MLLASDMGCYSDRRAEERQVAVAATALFAGTWMMHIPVALLTRAPDTDTRASYRDHIRMWNC